MTQYPRDGGYSELPEHSVALCFSLEVKEGNGLKIKGSAKMHGANVSKKLSSNGNINI